jgi:hypothetical protein
MTSLLRGIEELKFVVVVGFVVGFVVVGFVVVGFVVVGFVVVGFVVVGFVVVVPFGMEVVVFEEVVVIGVVAFEVTVGTEIVVHFESKLPFVWQTD